SLSLLRQHTRSTLFPYTTLFRSSVAPPRSDRCGRDLDGGRGAAGYTVSSWRSGGCATCGGGRRLAQGRVRPAGGCRSTPRACPTDRKSTRLNSSHVKISYAVFCL